MELNLFDSHCHLEDQSYLADLDDVLKRARSAGVRSMMTVGTDLEASRRAVSLASMHPGVFAAVGLHPHDASTCSDAVLSELLILAADPHTKAWGETGLDFNRMHSPRKAQEDCFARQLEISAQTDLPMIFHERDSQGNFLRIIKQHWNSRRTGVVHCFSGDTQELTAYLDLGLYIGITGILTIQGRGGLLREQVAHIPRERLLIETDAPYLTPTPERNKFRRNEPAFIRSVLLKLADILQEDPPALAETIWLNTCRLFRLQLEYKP